MTNMKIKLLPKIKHWLKKNLFGSTYIYWIPGEASPPPLTGDMMEKAYRIMVDSGVVKYGEPVFVETYKKRGRKLTVPPRPGAIGPDAGEMAPNGEGAGE